MYIKSFYILRLLNRSENQRWFFYDWLRQCAKSTLNTKDKANEIKHAKFAGRAKRSTWNTRKTKGLIPYSISYSWTPASLTMHALLNMLVDIRRVLSQFMPSLIVIAVELRKPTQRMLGITLGFIFDECETRLQFEGCIENKRMTA